MTLFEAAKPVADYIRTRKFIQVVSHLDADGITAGSIASATLTRLGIEHKVRFIKQLDPPVIEEIKNQNPEAAWFCDLGSGQLPQLLGINSIITDHHTPAPMDRGNILSYNARSENHLNPHFHGIDGSTEVSGAGVTYTVARAADKEANKDLAALAVLGAVADIQDAKDCKLTGFNREIMKDGKAAKTLRWSKDIRFFGKETRPLSKLLRYASDPLLPGISDTDAKAMNFLKGVEIPLKAKNRWRKWTDLKAAEKKKMLEAMRKILDEEASSRLTGEVYIFPNEERGTALREAKEFSTLLNSCGRYDRAEIGLRICQGDRDKALDDAKKLLTGHRRNLVDTLKIVREFGILELENIQYFHGGNAVQETVAGTVAGMLLGSGSIRDDLPIIAFANKDDGAVKVSSRATRKLVARGLDLSAALKQASAVVGGVGGGHNIAAGATIPAGTEDEFLASLNAIIKKQLEES